jgi:hypothetical protein
MKHEKTEMRQIDVVRKISRPTPSFRGGKGVWLRIMECPECYLLKSPPRNLGRFRKYYCSGATTNV